MTAPIVRALALAVATALTPAQDEAIRGDLVALQGAWIAKVGPDTSAEIALTIKGRTATVRSVAADGQPTVITSTLVRDEAARPRRLDSRNRTLADGRVMPELLALYELDGDTFRVCNNGPGKPRPERLEEGAEGLPVLTVFRRVKAPPADKP